MENGRRRKMAVLPPQSVPCTTSGILRSGQTHCSSGVQPTLKAGKSDMDVPTAEVKAGKSNKIKKRPSQTTATARNLTTATTTTYQTNQNKHKKLNERVRVAGHPSLFFYKWRQMASFPSCWQ